MESPGTTMGNTSQARSLEYEAIAFPQSFTSSSRLGGPQAGSGGIPFADGQADAPAPRPTAVDEEEYQVASHAHDAFPSLHPEVESSGNDAELMRLENRRRKQDKYMHQKCKKPSIPPKALTPLATKTNMSLRDAAVLAKKKKKKKGKKAHARRGGKTERDEGEEEEEERAEQEEEEEEQDGGDGDGDDENVGDSDDAESSAEEDSEQENENVMSIKYRRSRADGYGKDRTRTSPATDDIMARRSKSRSKESSAYTPPAPAASAAHSSDALAAASKRRAVVNVLVLSLMVMLALGAHSAVMHYLAAGVQTAATASASVQGFAGNVVRFVGSSWGEALFRILYPVLAFALIWAIKINAA